MFSLGQVDFQWSLALCKSISKICIVLFSEPLFNSKLQISYRHWWMALKSVMIMPKLNYLTIITLIFLIFTFIKSSIFTFYDENSFPVIISNVGYFESYFFMKKSKNILLVICYNWSIGCSFDVDNYSMGLALTHVY